MATIGRTPRRTTRGINRLEGSVAALLQPSNSDPRLFGALPEYGHQFGINLHVPDGVLGLDVEIPGRLDPDHVVVPLECAPFQPVDLDPAVPVYILYLTVTPTPDGLAFHPDAYGRDSRLLARLRASGHDPTKA